MVALGIEPKSRASEAPILSVVLRDRCGAAKVATKAGAAKPGWLFWLVEGVGHNPGREKSVSLP